MKLRFSIASLMALFLFCAVALAAWRSASPLWANIVLNLTVAILLVAAYKARYSRGLAGAWWFGFALLGWADFAVGMAATPWGHPWVNVNIVTHVILWKLMDVLPAPATPYSDGEEAVVRFLILQNVTSLLVAWMGAVIVRFLAVRGTKGLILHITQGDAWEEAKARGSYRPASLADEGFIHASTPEQVVRTANTLFKGTHGLVLLQIDPTKLEAPLRYESPKGSDEKFPHIYGPLNLDAVVKVQPFEPGADGLFAPPADEKP